MGFGAKKNKCGESNKQKTSRKEPAQPGPRKHQRNKNNKTAEKGVPINKKT